MSKSFPKINNVHVSLWASACFFSTVHSRDYNNFDQHTSAPHSTSIYNLFVDCKCILVEIDWELIQCFFWVLTVEYHLNLKHFCIQTENTFIIMFCVLSFGKLWTSVQAKKLHIIHSKYFGFINVLLFEVPFCERLG